MRFAFPGRIILLALWVRIHCCACLVHTVAFKPDFIREPVTPLTPPICCDPEESDPRALLSGRHHPKLAAVSAASTPKLRWPLFL